MIKVLFVLAILLTGGSYYYKQNQEQTIAKHYWCYDHSINDYIRCDYPTWLMSSERF